MIKYLVTLCVGVAVGVGGTMYQYDANFKASTNAHIDSVVSSAATSAHNAIQAQK
jgi:hypothetical protein